MVAPDKNLGEYEKEFANTMCLLEEREPYGNSDNTIKMLDRLTEDNDNIIDTVGFLQGPHAGYVPGRLGPARRPMALAR